MEETPMTVRLPADLHKALREAADKNERSLHGEILFRLKASVKK
jgi:predicted HicB family RNase H-like nuclease